MNHGMVPDNIQERLTSSVVYRNLTSLQASKIVGTRTPWLGNSAVNEKVCKRSYGSKQS